MKDQDRIDYSALDQPEVSAVLFHPRPDHQGPESARSAAAVRIPVDNEIHVGAKFHVVDKASPTILFFHGNGEIVSDYDDMVGLYRQAAINFFPVDYRGYGFSDGSPTVTAMLRDAHAVFAFVTDWMKKNGFSGELTIMGRSLGSAPAIEIAVSYPDRIAGMVIESGFAFAVPLLRLIGVDVERLGIREAECMGNHEKMKRIHKPVRIIHAEFDHIIPFTDGVALYEACSAEDKQLIQIPGADHNSIFYHGMEIYMQTLRDFLHGKNPF
jgi:pimeloyl-ACP methyl ester carboxylesterase